MSIGSHRWTISKLNVTKRCSKCRNKVVSIHIKRKFIFIICHKRRNIYGSFDASIYCFQHFIGFSRRFMGAQWKRVLEFNLIFNGFSSIDVSRKCSIVYAVLTIFHKGYRWHEVNARIINGLQRNIFGLCPGALFFIYFHSVVVVLSLLRFFFRLVQLRFAFIIWLYLTLS